MPMIPAEFFVALDGKRGNKGTIEEPWDLRTASEHPIAVRPGDVIYMRGGTYEIQDRLNLNLRLKGDQDQPVTLRPYGKERVVIDGGIHVLEPWVVLRDLEIRNSIDRRITTIAGPFPADIPQPTGINVFAPNVKVINNIVHDAANGLSSWVSAPDGEFYGNIAYYNGWIGPDRPHGHGVYMQNKDGAKILADNVIFNNFEYGMQIYGSSDTFLNGFQLGGNVVFNNGSLGGAWSRNILLGGTTVVAKPVLVDNFTYFPLTGNHGGDNNIGYYPNGSGCTGLQMKGNIFASGGIALTMHNCEVDVISSNKFIGQTRGFDVSRYSGANSFTMAQPTGTAVYVRPNKYERGRGHVIVYNWDRAEAIEADLSTLGLTPEDTIEIRDVQNVTGQPVFVGDYKGERIRVPMTSIEVSKPVGEVKYPPTHSDREFGVFLVRVVGTKAPPEANFTAQTEAESGSLSDTTFVQSREDASGGVSISFAPDGSSWGAYLFEIPKEGDYAVWIRGRQASGSSSEISLRVNSADPVTSVFPAEGGSGWIWSFINQRSENSDAQPVQRIVHLTAGSHWLTLSSADAGLELDALLITSDLKLIPTGPLGQPATEAVPEVLDDVEL
ncbi:MAG TPA: right-handed parallel beta-helix repeat-containing protein [Bryobacteraceae bacterium]|nr:right-handed parallel beta-helix repeat-containing protein [Bryobacteraceae bacterium]